MAAAVGGWGSLIGNLFIVTIITQGGRQVPSDVVSALAIFLYVVAYYCCGISIGAGMCEVRRRLTVGTSTALPLSGIVLSSFLMAILFTIWVLGGDGR